jgi:hypothetical protein
MLGFAPRPWISSIDGTFSWAMFDLFRWLYNWLVVFATPLKKKKFVSWDDEIPNINGKIIQPCSSPHQPRICEGFVGDFLGFIDIHR